MNHFIEFFALVKLSQTSSYLFSLLCFYILGTFITKSGKLVSI